MRDTVVQDGDPVLRTKAKTLTHKDIASPATAKVIVHMKKVLAKEKHGVAIAAPQVGESLRIFVVAGRVFNEAQGEEPNPSEKNLGGGGQREHFGDKDFSPKGLADKVFINPEIVRLSRAKKEMSEGCLSVRGKYGTVMRHEKASVKALDEHGKAFTYHGTGLIAEIFQHECDHLDGILYIDKAVRLEDDEEMESAAQKIKRKIAKP